MFLTQARAARRRGGVRLDFVLLKRVSVKSSLTHALEPHHIIIGCRSIYLRFVKRAPVDQSASVYIYVMTARLSSVCPSIAYDHRQDITDLLYVCTGTRILGA